MSVRGVWIAGVLLVATSAAAQMGGHDGTQNQPPQPGMGMQQGQQMMGGQMMSQQMMHDMSGMMQDMNAVMANMSHQMERGQNMGAEDRREMSRLMQEMSDGMHDLSQQMTQGKMDPGTAQKMRQRIHRMNQMLDGMAHTDH